MPKVFCYWNIVIRFNWGANMQRKSEEILKLLGGRNTTLKEARLRALKVTREIQGFGRSTASPSSTSSSSSATSESSRTNSNSSFGSFSTNGITSTSNEIEKVPENELINPITTKELVGSYSHGGIYNEEDDMLPSLCGNVEGLHLWDSPSIQEKGSFLEGEEDNGDEEYEKEKDINGFVGGIFSKLTSTFSPSSRDYHGFRSVSDVGRVTKKKYNRQFSLWY